MTSLLLSATNINPHVLEMKYAVRGEVLDVATALKKQLLADPTSLPFPEVVSCNIGNPQALGQAPPAFARQVISLVVNSDLIKSCPQAFLPQAIERAKLYLDKTNGIGAYSGSQGVEIVRKEVSDFISRRDGYPCDHNNIFLTNGASDGVKALMQTTIRGGTCRDGVLVPIPQYPLYSALTTLFDGELIGYYLDELSDWSFTIDELIRSTEEAVAKGISVRALVIINPGNPTSAQLNKEQMIAVVNFCEDRSIVLMADEVYQENLYGQSTDTFISFKQVVCEMKSAVQLVSFHSVSKGYTGECGIRGGYFELHNIASSVKQQLYQLASISLCSNMVGQLAVGLMVNPPTDGEAGALQQQHRDDIMNSLETRQNMLAETLNKMEGVTCSSLSAAMYGFPRIALPLKAIEAAKRRNKQPDLFYCLEMLKKTGIITVPGSGFKQKENEYHFRITILPPMNKFDAVMNRLQTFHQNFMNEYR